MKDLMSKLGPRKFLSVFDLYIQIKNSEEKEIKLPLVVLSLSNGVSLSGEIVAMNEKENLLSLFLSEPNYKNSVSFIHMNTVVSVTFKDIDLCPEFLDKLVKLR